VDHTVIAAAIAQWCSRLNACVPVNGVHFEHKFWVSDFLLCFVCFIDTGFCKCDRYKHVQSANIGVKCVTFVFEIFTWYGSNITSVWQEIFTSMILAFCYEVVHKKLWKSVNICKTYSKKISVTFFLDTVYVALITNLWSTLLLACADSSGACCQVVCTGWLKKTPLHFQITLTSLTPYQ